MYQLVHMAELAFKRMPCPAGATYPDFEPWYKNTAGFGTGFRCKVIIQDSDENQSGLRCRIVVFIAVVHWMTVWSLTCQVFPLPESAVPSPFVLFYLTSASRRGDPGRLSRREYISDITDAVAFLVVMMRLQSVRARRVALIGEPRTRTPPQSKDTRRRG